MRFNKHTGTPTAIALLCAGALILTHVAPPAYAQAEPVTEEVPAAPPLEEVQVDSAQLKDFHRAIDTMESRAGAYAAMLPEQLLGMGLALQSEGRHADAIAVFKRGSHLARINNGLYSATQIPFLEREIRSQLALGELQKADEGQSRLYRVQKRSLADTDTLVDALMQQADWQRRAYKLGIGGEEMSFTHLLKMWDLNRMALTTLIDKEGDKSPKLLPPLFAMLQAQYLISSHSDHSKTASYDFDSQVGSREKKARFNSYLAKSYDMGRSIIRAIYDIQFTQSGEKSLPTIEIRIMLADWMLWHGVRDPAKEAYALAATELAELDDAQLQTQRLLGEPVPLPDLDGVRPLLPEVGITEGNVLVEFEVSAGGKVKNVSRIRDDESAELSPDEASEGKANRLLRALRRTKFRPRFVDGVPTPTKNIVKAYAIPN